MFGVDKREKLIIPHARPGDAVIVSKGPAIETTGLMAAYFPRFLEKKYGKKFVRCAQDVYYQMSTVKDALVAAGAGGVTAMHDATECGVLGGLCEIAAHSNVGMHIDLDEMILHDEVRFTCECFELDPYISISEGTLLATASKARAPGVVNALQKAGIPASIIGKVVKRNEGMYYSQRGRRYPLHHPGTDPFWIRFEEYFKKNAG